MDDELKDFIRIHPVQAELIACRNNTHYFRKIIKQTWKEKLNALQNAEILIVDKQLNLPDSEKWTARPNISIEPQQDQTEVLNDYKRTLYAFELLK